eukprot:jgi/Bigna1/61539/fgenesh1_kg.23_\
MHPTLRCSSKRNRRRWLIVLDKSPSDISSISSSAIRRLRGLFCEGIQMKKLHIPVNFPPLSMDYHICMKYNERRSNYDSSYLIL